MRISFFFHTISYLKFEQIFFRFWFRLKSRFLQDLMRKQISQLTCPVDPPKFNLKPKCYGKIANQNLNERRFKFINIETEYEKNIFWNDTSKPKLWLYNLHYFEYLLPLTKEINADNFDYAQKLIKDWIEQNPVGRGNGWEPYPLSLRIVNWIFFYDAFYDYFKNNPKFKRQFLDSLYRQTAYLTHFLEYHLQANHLWANVKTVLFAGLFFSENKWIEKGIRLVKRQLKEQILNDGGHYERSPMYHSLILTDVIDLANLLKTNNPDLNKHRPSLENLRKMLQEKAQAMLQWLNQLSHPDGEPALFGDTAFKVAPKPEDIHDYYSKVFNSKNISFELPKTISLKESGYYVVRSDETYMAVDGGELGVTYQPGHAHCDFLSYELSFKTQRFIVDSGVGEYLPSDLRSKARSIYSHNTLVVNGMEQAELWQAFRMGKRIKPEAVRFKAEPFPEFAGSYKNQLNKKRAYRHQRFISWQKTNMIVIKDVYRAKRLRFVENLIHPHPECRLEQTKGSILLKRNGIELAVLFDENEAWAEIRDWFYVPEFGKVIPSKVIVLIPKDIQKGQMEYRLKPC